jgi:tetratricopeptide (TPR) repeat protein
MVGRDSVFVSYAREDAAFAQRLAAGLRERGLDVWIDTNLRAGTRWDREVHEAIRACGRMVVVLSPRSVESTEVPREWSFALDDGDLVVPILYEPCEVPYRLRLHQHVDFTRDYAAALEQLVRSLGVQSASSAETVARTDAPRLPSRRALGAVLAVAVLLPIAALVWPTLWRRPDVASELPVPTAAQPSPKPKAAVAEVSGERLIEQYRTTADSRSRFLSSRERWLSAAESFEEAAESRNLSEQARASYRSRARFCRGRANLLSGELEPALQNFRASLEADDRWAPPSIELAVTLTRLERYEDAHAAARRALRVEPDFWLARIAAAPIYAAEGKLHDAIRTYEAVASGSQSFPSVEANLALAYHAAGLHEERAKELAEKALERDADLAPALIVLAERALEAGRAETARSYSQRLVDTAVFDVAAWLVHGDALLALDRKKEAQAAFERALEEFDRTREPGAPLERLKQVRNALARGKLPGRRFAAPEQKDRSIPKHTGSSSDPAPHLRTHPKSPDFGF